MCPAPAGRTFQHRHPVRAVLAVAEVHCARGQATVAVCIQEKRGKKMRFTRTLFPAFPAFFTAFPTPGEFVDATSCAPQWFSRTPSASSIIVTVTTVSFTTMLHIHRTFFTCKFRPVKRPNLKPKNHRPWGRLPRRPPNFRHRTTFAMRTEDMRRYETTGWWVGRWNTGCQSLPPVLNSVFFPSVFKFHCWRNSQLSLFLTVKSTMSTPSAMLFESFWLVYVSSFLGMKYDEILSLSVFLAM